jgi:hypothetical protein
MKGTPAEHECFAAVRGAQDHVAAASKDGPGDAAHVVLVLDEQDRLVAARGPALGRYRGDFTSFFRSIGCEQRRACRVERSV